MPLLDARDELELSPPGFEGTEGRDPAVPDPPAEVVRVAMAVGKTKDGSEFPAKLGIGRWNQNESVRRRRVGETR